MIEYSEQQQEALDSIGFWHSEWDPGEWFYLAGPAGTGKTTIAKSFYTDSFVRMVQGEKGEWAQTVHRVQYGAYTGKAASVMRKKGCIGAATLHSLIYRPHVDIVTGEVRYFYNTDSPLKYCSMIVIDECSMCNDEISKDLLSFNKPLVVIGDKHQLPPIQDAGYFTSGEPDYLLTEIHRQAADNPIIAASMLIREGKPYRDLIDTCYEGKLDDAELLEYDQILVGTNAKRARINRTVRKLQGRTDTVEVGEKLICLKNDRKVGCFNGTTWEVTKVFEQWKYADTLIHSFSLKPLDEDANEIIVNVPDEFFRGTEKTLDRWTRMRFQEFTYGYAMTVHKAQGSQWDSVLLFDEARSFREHAKNWLYTGITRAAEKVKVVI